MQWEKCRYKANIETMFSDTAQYIHTKKPKNALKQDEKHFFQWNGVFGQKRFFFQVDRKLLLHANFIKPISSLCWTQNVSFYS